MHFLTKPLLMNVGFWISLHRLAWSNSTPKASAENLFMSWANVQELADSSLGITIGSHAHSHRKLASSMLTLSVTNLAGSKQILQAKLRRPDQGSCLPLWLARNVHDANQGSGNRGRL